MLRKLAAIFMLTLAFVTALNTVLAAPRTVATYQFSAAEGENCCDIDVCGPDGTQLLHYDVDGCPPETVELTIYTNVVTVPLEPPFGFKFHVYGCFGERGGWETTFYDDQIGPPGVIWSYDEEKGCWVGAVEDWTDGDYNDLYIYVYSPFFNKSYANWTATEGCPGFQTIARVGGFRVELVGPYSDLDILEACNETIYEDSGGLSWIEAPIRYHDALNLTQLAENLNKTVSELTPWDVMSFMGVSLEQNKVIFVKIGEEINFQGAIAIAYPGVVFYKSLFQGIGSITDIALHELAHEAGFCDPDPYAEWKQFWRGLFEPPLSEWTNSTWHFEQNRWHLWAYLASTPVYLANRPGPLVLRMRSSDARTVTISVEVAQGHVTDNQKQITVGEEWQDVVFIYNPPDVDNLSIIEVAFTMFEDQSGLNRVLTYYLTVIPSSWAEQLNLSVSDVFPTEWPENLTYPPLLNIPQELWNQVYSLLTSYNWSSLNPYVAKAEENMQKAMEDAQLAKQTNNTCIKWLYSQAAQLRFYAAQLYTQAAQAWEEVLSAQQQMQSMPWSFYPFYMTQLAGAGWDYTRYAATAQEYEAKAAQLETQALLGCPEGFLSGPTGLNPLLGLGGILGFFDEGSHSISWMIFVVGAVLALIGLLGLLFKQKQWTRMFPIGIVLCVIALLLMGVI